MKCEKCDKDHDGSFGSGRFCSRSCSNSRVRTEETKNKISKGVNIWIKEHGRGTSLQTEKRKKEFIEAGKRATQIWREKNLKELMSVDFESLKFDRMRKRILIEQDYKCIKCGLNEWMGKPLPLEIDHKDGDHHNNSRKNVEALCPNCHSLTSTWRGRNKNRGQKKKKQKITDEMRVQAFLETGNIRQALIKLKLAAKGNNYKLMKRALTMRGIKYK